MPCHIWLSTEFARAHVGFQCARTNLQQISCLLVMTSHIWLYIGFFLGVCLGGWGWHARVCQPVATCM